VTLQCRAGAGANQVTVLDVRPLPDSNALTHHILDAINTHLLNTRGPLPRGGAGAGAGGGFAATSTAGIAHAAMMGLTSGAAVGPAAAGGGDGGDASYVLGLFRDLAPEREDGAAVRDVAAAAARDPARRHLTMDAITRLAEQLMMEGHIYSTVDESHYKTTT
jgi:replication factor A2